MDQRNGMTRIDNSYVYVFRNKLVYLSFGEEEEEEEVIDQWGNEINERRRDTSGIEG